MTTPEILMVAPMPTVVLRGIEARFRLHRLWEAEDGDAFLREVGPRIRGVATGAFASTDAALIDRLPNLEIIANFGVGYDSVDVAHAATRGIVVTNTPDVLTDEVADVALGLLLMTVRELSAAERYLRAGKWVQAHYPLTRTTLRGRTVGIVGLGRIGKAIARRLEGFGVGIVYHSRRPQPDVAYRHYDSLLAMARDVDTLIVVLPGGADTKHIVGAEVLCALGPEGIVINIGRGSVIDEAALIKALQDGVIASAGLDVFENEPHVPQELIAMDRVVLLPHVGSGSMRTRDAMGQLVVDNLVSWFETGAPLTPVPETPARPRTKSG